MARHPDLFRAGVALAPVTDWDGYDTAYTERYMGTRPRGRCLCRQLALADAGSIVGDLLLIHGELDENVHLRHSVRMLAALQRRGAVRRARDPAGPRHRTRGRGVVRSHLRDGRRLRTAAASSARAAHPGRSRAGGRFPLAAVREVGRCPPRRRAVRRAG